MRIGRHRTSDIFVDNLKISNRHCSLYLIDGSAFIEDTSSNGTKLNGIRLEKGQRRPVSFDRIILFISYANGIKAFKSGPY